MSALLWAAAAAAVVVLLVFAPRWWTERQQDRLAERLVAPGGEPFRLLTRAELVVGRRRRVPGVMGLVGEAVVFHGIFEERMVVPTARIDKIVTGRRLADGRELVRREALRLTRSGAAEELQFVMTIASASAWRSHLGLWAVSERMKNAQRPAASAPNPEADLVRPGR